MRIQQLADCEISVNRFDTGECINIGYMDIVDLDDETANFLLAMSAFDENGNLASNFVVV